MSVHVQTLFQELYRDKNKVEKIQLLHYLICRLLPVLEQVNREQSIELDIEAKITGIDDDFTLIFEAVSHLFFKHYFGD